MAEKGAGGDWPSVCEGATGGENPEAAGNGSRTGTSTEQIVETGNVLLNGFIADQVQRTPNRPTDALAELGVQSAPADPRTKELSECLRKIGDELDGNMELQRMIEQVQSDSPKEVFFKVASEMFSDGNFNWGRVVALFYFASRLIIKHQCPLDTFIMSHAATPLVCHAVGKALLTNVPKITRTIIDWTMEYFRVNVVQWIRDQGGWENIISYVSTPTWQTVCIFFSGVLAAAFTIWRMK
uniref:Bcl-2 Bcl-2 homology region 1-3 domain-containing protein n=1 Tax=Leptobrachium leishanense TaxID=445787 RepID=A0A8C5PKU5_9ANUR